MKKMIISTILISAFLVTGCKKTQNKNQCIQLRKNNIINFVIQVHISQI